jgi:hypothetical protein
MAFVNLAAQGVPQDGHPDIITVWKNHPEVIHESCALALEMNPKLDTSFVGRLETVAGVVAPDWIASGYRDKKVDPNVRIDPHWFAVAVDPEVLPIEADTHDNRVILLNEQIRWVTRAIARGTFLRCGIYPQQNTCHLDTLDKAWMDQYGGAKFWVKYNGVYEHFDHANGMIDYAHQCLYNEGRS